MVSIACGVSVATGTTFTSPELGALANSASMWIPRLAGGAAEPDVVGLGDRAPDLVLDHLTDQ
jgi:hypothetical protein